jgi:hypothetical protein
VTNCQFLNKKFEKFLRKKNLGKNLTNFGKKINNFLLSQFFLKRKSMVSSQWCDRRRGEAHKVRA